MKKALVTGIFGQDGAYLARFLLSKGYEVIGGTRRSASDDGERLRRLGIKNKIEIINFDLTDQYQCLTS